MLPNQLQHLAPQMWDFARPSIYGGLEDKLVERFTTDRDYSGHAARQADLRQHRRRPVPAGSRRRAARPVPAARPAAPIRGPRRDAVDGETRVRARASPSAATAGDDRGHAADPRHRPRLHRQAGQGRQPRRVRAVDPQRRCRSTARASSWSAATASRCSTATTDADRPRAAAGARRRTRGARSAPLLIVGREGRRHVVHAVPDRADGELDLSRFDTGGVENAESAQQLSRLPVLRSRHLPAGRDRAPRHDRADRRLEGVARPACRSTSRSPIRAALVVSRTELKLSPTVVRRGHLHQLSRRRRPAPTRRWRTSSRTTQPARRSAARRSRCRNSSRTA